VSAIFFEMIDKVVYISFSVRESLFLANKYFNYAIFIFYP